MERNKNSGGKNHPKNIRVSTKTRRDTLDVSNRHADKNADAGRRRASETVTAEEWENFLESGKPRRTGDKIRNVGHSIKPRLQGHCGNDGAEERRQKQGRSTAASGFWDAHEWIQCKDGKARRVPTTESGIRILVNGLEPKLLEIALKGAGNGIVISLATRFIQAYMRTK